MADGDEALLDPKALVINAHGLENTVGLRGVKDGIVFFGSKKESGENQVNDYVVEGA